jgi:(S)-mandelate dehydrogenase
MALLDALCRRRLRAAHSIDDLRDAARRTLPRMVFDYVDGGAQSESTMRQNRAAFERHRLLSAAPVDVSRRSMATALFGQSLAMPLIIGPTGYASAFWPKGDLALARGAAAAGVPFVVSNGANAAARPGSSSTSPMTSRRRSA